MIIARPSCVLRLHRRVGPRQSFAAGETEAALDSAKTPEDHCGILVRSLQPARPRS